MGYVGQGTYSEKKKTRLLRTFLKQPLDVEDQLEDPREDGGTKFRRL